MIWTVWVFLGAVLAGSGVGFGAFGAHYLKDRLDANALQVFETAARYQMYHALALLFVGLLAMRIDNWFIRCSGILFFIGTLLFSGSLYAIVLLGQKQLGIITPIGGVFILIAWFLLAVSILYISFA